MREQAWSVTFDTGQGPACSSGCTAQVFVLAARPPDEVPVDVEQHLGGFRRVETPVVRRPGTGLGVDHSGDVGEGQVAAQMDTHPTNLLPDRRGGLAADRRGERREHRAVLALRRVV